MPFFATAPSVFGILGCKFPKYMILAKSVLDESEPQIVLSTTVGMSEKNGLKYVRLSTDFSDDVSRENGPVRAPSERRNAPPGSPGRP